MKPIVPARTLVLVLIAFLAGNARSQSIHVERVMGELRVNGEPIAAESLPEELDLGEAEFSLQSSGNLPMRVEINGARFDIWQDRVSKADQAGPVHFKLSIGPDGTYTSIESGAPDVHGLAEMLSQQVTGALSGPEMEMWNSVNHNPHIVAERMSELQDGSAVFSQGMNSMWQDARRMLEVSSYLANVQSASSELFELLRHEWREEVQAVEMAARIRMLEDGEERDEAIEELREKLEEVFLMKQENRRMEIQHLETELERMENRLMERSQAKDRLIDARLDELLGAGR